MSKLRYYRQKFDPARARPFRGEAEDFGTVASDGTRIEGTHLAATTTAATAAFVLAHGLFGNRRLPSLIELAESLTRFGPVWTMDLRGHGTSGGTCSLGEREAWDIAAVTAVARAESPLPVVSIGLSMGAAAAIRAGALVLPPDAVVAISGPSEWLGHRGYGAWRTALAWRVPGAPAAVRRVTGIRLSPSRPGGPSPAAAIADLAPAPVLIVHGTKDPFFPADEALDLHRRAGDPKDLWIIPGGGHAEGLFCDPGRPVVRERVDAFVDEVARRLALLLAPGDADRRLA